jgi:protoporphyrinogen oxidase
MKVTDPKVLIVGGGLAGLCCGIELQKSHIPFKILEADDQIGGRVQTDVVDGFLLDRGFQVLLSAYPECRRMLDYEALKLRRFYPGALIWFEGKFHRITDPWRQPFSALKTVFSPIGTLNDKIRISRLRRKTTSGTLDSLFEHPETSTLLAIKEMGFSDGMINRFFKPFFGGIFLDRSLETSSRMLEFTFRMFSTGDTV